MAEAEAEHKKTGSTRKPLFVIGNHTSFMDTILSVATTPASALWWARTYMADYLYKLPILGTACKCCGHFPVHFCSTEEGKFKVDADKAALVDKDVDAHISRGGWLFFYPEGAMNKKPDELLTFRYGGMKKAIACDARIAASVFIGNQTTWPMKSQLGGFPAKLSYNMKYIAPKGAKAYVAELRESQTAEEKEMPDHELLSKKLQQLMQAQYDELKSNPPHSSMTTLIKWVTPAATIVVAGLGFYQKFLKRS